MFFWDNNHNKLNIIISALFVLFCCGLYLLFLYRLLIGNFNDIANCLLAILFSPYLFAMAWMELQVGTRKCKITQDGICVKYLFSAEKLFSWEQFQQICLCFEPMKKRYIPPRFTDQEIICFVLKQAKKDSWGFWNVYSKRYFRTILFIRYSEEVMKTLREHCPTSIIDLRQEQIFQNRWWMKTYKLFTKFQFV